MDKIQAKIEIENFIIAILIQKFSLLPFFLQRANPEDFTKLNRLIIERLIELKNEKEMSKEEIFVHLMRIKEFPRSLFLDIVNSIYASENKLDNLLMQFVDVTLSIRYDAELKSLLQENETDLNGLDAISKTIDKLKDLEKDKIEKFRQVKSFSESLPETLREIENELTNENLDCFKFPSLPSMNDLFVSTNLISILGSFKSGKSSLALNAICDLAAQNIPVGIISLEVSEKELKRKILGMRSGINYDSLRIPKFLNETDKTKLHNLYKKNEKFPLYISDKRQNILEIESTARIWKERFNIKCLVIDYLGLVMQKGNKSTESRERETAYNSASLKMLAKELDILVICLSQLNRSGISNPTSENTAESLGVIRDSDAVFIIYRPLSMGIQKLPINGNEIYFNENHFIVKLDQARHVPAGKSFLLQLDNSGKMREMATEYVKQERLLESIF